MRSGEPHRGGLPGQPGRVTLLAWVSFLHVKAEGGITRLTGVMSIRAFINYGCQPPQAWRAFLTISSSKRRAKKILKRLTVPATI